MKFVLIIKTRGLLRAALTPVIFLAGLIWLFWPVRAAAQADGFMSQASYTFGQTMWFQLTATTEVGTAGWQSAVLFFRASEFTNAFSSEATIVSRDPLQVTHQVDLSQVQLAPYTTVTYWWVLRTETGEEVRLPEQTVLYEDDQFTWRRLSQNSVTVNWTGDDPALGQLALDVVNESLPRLRAFIPVEEDPTLRLYIYPSSADLRAALRLTGRDWVGGHADPRLGVILVTAVNMRTAAADLRQSIPHELAHHLLYQATGPAYDSVPLWFNEGVATFVEQAPNPAYRPILQTAVAQQATIPFAELRRYFPATEQEALLAYAQSLSLIQHIQARHGNSAIRRLVDAFADGADCHSGVQRILQTSLVELNREWLQAQQPVSPLRQFWQRSAMWLLLLAASFGLTSLLIFNWKPSS